jgi:hypothetical protein
MCSRRGSRRPSATVELVRIVDELEFAFGWIAPEPRFMQRASHAVVAGGRVWVLDPVAGGDVLDRVRALGEPAGVVQLLDRHGRDCALFARELDVPHHRVPDTPPAGAPFEVLPVLHRKRWHEIALWFPAEQTLACADALGTAPYYRARSERIGVSPLLRLTPPRSLLRVAPVHVLVGHGAGVHDEATAAVGEAVSGARRRLAPWLWAALRSRAQASSS